MFKTKGVEASKWGRPKPRGSKHSHNIVSLPHRAGGGRGGSRKLHATSSSQPLADLYDTVIPEDTSLRECKSRHQVQGGGFRSPHLMRPVMMLSSEGSCLLELPETTRMGWSKRAACHAP